MGTPFEASTLLLTMESLRIRKKSMALEVTYKAGRISIEPLACYPEYERSVQVIAKSEQLLSAQHLKFINSGTPYEDLKMYFETKGWEVIAVY